jgi:hypothetical protein
MSSWRVNFGNGQVQYAPSRAEALRAIQQLDRYREYAFVERYEGGSADEPGDWFPIRRGEGGEGGGERAEKSLATRIKKLVGKK